MIHKEINESLEIGPKGPTHYEVFARLNSRESLTHIGSVEAPNSKLAKARAWFVFDHHPWQEMLIVPSSSVIPVINEFHYAKIKGA